MSNQSFLVIDTETGGLDSSSCQLLEIAACVYDDCGNKLGQFHQMLSPQSDKKLGLFALKLNKYFERENLESVDNSKVALDFVKWSIDMANRYSPIIVGQNVLFDIRFIDQFLGEFGYEDWQGIFPRQLFDTMNIAKVLQYKQILKTKKLSLSAISQELDIVNPEAHTALADVETTYKVLMKLLSKIN